MNGKEKEPVDDKVYITLNQHVALTFSLKYLVNFAKAQSLSQRVMLCMSGDVPLLVCLFPPPPPPPPPHPSDCVGRSSSSSSKDT